MSTADVRAMEGALRERLRELGLTIAKSHAYRLTDVPVHYTVFRTRWAEQGERLARRNITLNFAPPAVEWVGDGLSGVCFQFVQSEQRPLGVEPDNYVMDTVEGRAALVGDFETYCVPAIESSDRPEWLVEALLDGTVAPPEGRKRSGIATAQWAVQIARVWGLTAYDERIVALMRYEASISDARADAADRIAERFGIAYR